MHIYQCLARDLKTVQNDIFELLVIIDSDMTDLKVNKALLKRLEQLNKIIPKIITELLDELSDEY